MNQPLAEPSGEIFYPAELKARDWWVNWVLAYRREHVTDGEVDEEAVATKQPVDPRSRSDASPCKWNSGLSDEEHPSTSFKNVKEWDGTQIGLDIHAPDRVESDELGIGIIIPTEDATESRTVTLIDWDDVREPETGEIHPTCAWALKQLDGYAEISQSGEGIHQFVFAEIPGDLRKYLRHVDDEPFVGDDLPMFEMYSSGRLVAMTGRHIEGTGRDVVDGQQLIDELCYRFRNESNNSTPTPSHPFGGAIGSVPDRDAVDEIVTTDVEYNGDDPSEWDVNNDKIRYRAVLKARRRKANGEMPGVSNWKLIRYAALLGKENGESQRNIRLELLDANDWDGAKRRCMRQIKGAWRAHNNDRLEPPSVQTLKSKGVLPKEYVHTPALGADKYLSGADEWEVWADARKGGTAADAPELTEKALAHIAAEQCGYPVDKVPDEERLPIAAYNAALNWVTYYWATVELDIDNPDADDAAAVTTTTERSMTDDESVYCWQDVRHRYDELSKNHGRQAAETLLRRKYHFVTTATDETLFVYDAETGTYTTQLSQQGIRGEIKDGLQENWTVHELTEITARLRQDSFIERREFNGRQQFDTPHICVKNGVLNLCSGELRAHSPEYYFVDRVPVAYDPDADTSTYEQYLDEWTNRAADKKTLMEMVGHALVPDANERYKKFLILTGDADNGKSIFFNCVRQLLNGPNDSECNTSNVKLEKMSSQRFSNDSVYGHMANVAGEINGKKIRNTASLKDITGGDSIEIEPKNEQSFFDTINATMMFAANDPPILGERDKEAIASRIVPVQMPFSFVRNPDENDPFEKELVPEDELEAQLHSDEALSGFLRLAVEGVQRLEENHGDVSLPETPKERLERYERAADPMRLFGHECLTNEAGQYIVKADVTTVYKEWATSQGHELGTNTNTALHRALQGMEDLNYTTSRPSVADYSDVNLPLRPYDERKRVVSRMTFTEKGIEHAEAAGIMETDSDADGEQPDQPPLGGMDPGHGKTITATVTNVSKGEYSREAQGKLKGPQNTIISFVVPGANGNPMPAYQDDRVRFEGATLRKDDSGLRELVVDDAVTIEAIDDGDAETESDTDDDSPDSPPTPDTPDTTDETEIIETTQSGITDGGESDMKPPDSPSDTADVKTETRAETETDTKPSKDGTELTQSERKAKIQVLFSTTDGKLTMDELVDELGWRQNKIEATLGILKDRGTVVKSPDGYQMM